MTNRINGKQDETDKGPTPKKAPKEEPGRTVLSAAERLAFLLYAAREQIQQLQASNNQVMQANSQLAVENARLMDRVVMLETKELAAENRKLEQEFEFLKSPQVLCQDKTTGDYFLRPYVPQPKTQ